MTEFYLQVLACGRVVLDVLMHAEAKLLNIITAAKTDDSSAWCNARAKVNSDNFYQIWGAGYYELSQS